MVYSRRNTTIIRRANAVTDVFYGQTLIDKVTTPTIEGAKQFDAYCREYMNGGTYRLKVENIKRQKIQSKRRKS